MFMTEQVITLSCAQSSLKRTLFFWQIFIFRFPTAPKDALPLLSGRFDKSSRFGQRLIFYPKEAKGVKNRRNGNLGVSEERQGVVHAMGCWRPLGACGHRHQFLNRHGAMLLQSSPMAAVGLAPSLVSNWKLWAEVQGLVWCTTSRLGGIVPNRPPCIYMYKLTTANSNTEDRRHHTKNWMSMADG